jgi:hypothetical protein
MALLLTEGDMESDYNYISTVLGSREIIQAGTSQRSKQWGRCSS